jgi:hypothetical protein
MTSVQRVLVLWLLILVVFGLFCALYWPVRLHQRSTAPANFMRYADELVRDGQNEAAREVLENGIARMRPPGPEAYARLQAMHYSFGDQESAAKWEPALQFRAAYSTSGSRPEERDVALRKAAEGWLALHATPNPSAAMRDAVARCAVDLVAPFGAGRVALEMTPREQLALLAVGDGAFRYDGQVGETGIGLAAEILVQSGGGEGVHRVAHIYINGRDYGRRERGLQVALIAPRTGEILRWDVFDLFDRPAEGDRLLSWLAGTPDGVIGAFAVFDDGSANMTHALEEALLSFGLEREAIVGPKPSLVGLRYSFAAIGVKGAEQGTALQTWSPHEFDGHFGLPVAAGILGGKEARE